MWLFWASFAEACVTLGSSPASPAVAIPVEFWRGMQRALLVGMLNDGLFRGRFPVNGFPAGATGQAAVKAFVQALPDSQLKAELRTRALDSGLAG